MTILETFGRRGAPMPAQPKDKMPSIVSGGPRNGGSNIESDIADVVLAARERGDRALADAKAPARTPLPPTASNVFASNAVELLNKREKILNEAIMLANECDLLAGENIACGVRIQEFMKRTQDVTAAVSEAKTVLKLVPPQSDSQAEAPQQIEHQETAAFTNMVLSTGENT